LSVAADRYSPGSRRSSLRSRATAIGLTLAAELLFLLLLLGLNPSLPSRILSRPTMVSLDLTPATPETRQPVQARKQTAKALPKQVTPAPARPASKPPPLPPSPLIPLTKAELAAADIANLGTHAPGAKAAGSQTAAVGPGEGPGGAHLYNAEWYREPTDGELAFYMPKSGVDLGSWAQIGCQTVEHYHVDNCILLGESPPGSGLARAMRLASWQFLVRPPNVDGRPLVRSWVRIRIDFTRNGSIRGG
jgi:protein TonB